MNREQNQVHQQNLSGSVQFSFYVQQNSFEALKRAALNAMHLLLCFGVRMCHDAVCVKFCAGRNFQNDKTGHCAVCTLHNGNVIGFYW